MPKISELPALSFLLPTDEIPLVREGKTYKSLAVLPNSSAIYINKVKMVEDIQLPYPGGIEAILFLDPNGSDRLVIAVNVLPDLYPQGYRITIYNQGNQLIMFDPTGIGRIAAPGAPPIIMAWDGTNWN